MGSLWESKSKTNVAIALVEAGLAKFQNSFGGEIPDGHLLEQAEQSAKRQKLKVCEAQNTCIIQLSSF